MAKRDFIQRYIFIINRLNKATASFEELQDYLVRQEQITGDKLEISQRTLQRDLNEIRSLFDIDIQYNRKEGVYEIVEAITEKPIERIIESYEIIQALQFSNTVSQKLYLQQRKSKGTEHLHGLLHAIENRLAVTFTHHSYWKEEAENRTVHPIAIKEFENRWYLVCYDLDKKQVRNFGLDRILSLSITNQKFSPITFDVLAHYKHALGVETYEPAQKIVLQFSAFQAQYIKSLPLHPSQEITTENEDWVQFTYFMHPTHDLEMEILKYGEEVTVVSPETLKETITNRIKSMVALYQ